jgi:hypothetical protein
MTLGNSIWTLGEGIMISGKKLKGAPGCWKYSIEDAGQAGRDACIRRVWRLFYRNDRVCILMTRYQEGQGDQKKVMTFHL